MYMSCMCNIVVMYVHLYMVYMSCICHVYVYVYEYIYVHEYIYVYGIHDIYMTLITRDIYMILTMGWL